MGCTVLALYEPLPWLGRETHGRLKQTNNDKGLCAMKKINKGINRERCIWKVLWAECLCPKIHR